MTDIPKTRWDISPFITHTQDNRTHVYFKNIHI